MQTTKKNEILKQMFDWIYANTEARNQADIARKSGVFEATISRALNGKVKKVKQETLRKINSAFGNVFNPAWLRGDSDIMLIEELQKANQPAVANPDISISPGTPDISSLVNATLTAKDETIASLHRELDAKDGIIATLREQLTEHITLLQTIQRNTDNITAKYEDLLHEHRSLLRRINVNIGAIHDSHLSIAAEPSAIPYGSDDK